MSYPMQGRTAGGEVKSVQVTPDGLVMTASLAVDANGNPIPQVGDRELLVIRYTCKAAFDGCSVGDTIRQTQTLDVSGAATTVVSVLWENESTGAAISAPPSISANLEPIKQGDALTQAQLQASGLATAANQVTQIGYLADLADANDRHATYKLVQSEDLGAGTKYILKSNGTGWLMIRKTYTDTGSVMSYAGPGNNASTALADAWAARASMVYGNTIAGA